VEKSVPEDKVEREKIVRHAANYVVIGTELYRRCASNSVLMKCCRCLNLSTSMGGTRSKVEGEDRHDLEPEGTREDTRHKIYTGSGSQSSYPTSCLE
jgi:hypothetical protein